jgi:hypothetical protein
LKWRDFELESSQECGRKWAVDWGMWPETAKIDITGQTTVRCSRVESGGAETGEGEGKRRWRVEGCAGVLGEQRVWECTR